jgi:hypothetical protein
MSAPSERARSGVRAWVRQTGRGLRDVTGNGPVTFLPDGRTLAVGSPNWLVVLWHVDPSDVVRRLCATVTPQAHVAGQAPPRLCH